jgi:hypothetical protein
MVFGVMSGVLTLIPNPTASNPRGHRPLAIDAGWCELPARFRKAREHAINRLELVGQETYQQSSGSGPVLREAQRVYDNLTAQLSDGTVTRTLPSSLDLGHAADTYQTEANRFYSPEAANQANLYRTDDSARTPWAPDEFTVHLSRMADSVAANVVTRLCPRQPGETDGDGQVLRHVTVYRLADKDRFADGKPIMGYLTRGVMKIARGDIVFTLNLTPGLPVYTVAVPAPITVGIVDAAAYQAQPLSSIDPLIRIADLAYVAS